MLYCARLQDGDAALAHIDAMLDNLLEENGFIFHPPTRGAPAFGNVYELDGNTGLTACIAQMLLQSAPGSVHLLPALPAAWQSGRVTGLCAHGGVTADIAWESGALKEATLLCPKTKTVDVRWQNRNWRVTLKAGEPFVLR
jgi:alpha-L-fucosidase 2